LSNVESAQARRQLPQARKVQERLKHQQSSENNRNPVKERQPWSG
jgi:hypothetical protein